MNFLAPVTVALGNRAWGDGETKNWIGVAMMAFGIVIHYPQLWMWYPAFILSMLIFRSSGTGETWLAAEVDRNLGKAFWRSALVLPHALLITYLTSSWHPIAINWLPLILGLGFPIITVFYQLAGRTKVKDPTALAECLTGLYVGCI